MTKLCLILILILGIAAPGFGNLINGDWSTGDETGWTRWLAPWGSGNCNWAVTFSGPTAPEGTASLWSGDTGSFGWYQMVPCDPGSSCVLSADWAGDINGAGWAEVLFWTTPNPSEDIGLRTDTGNAADIAFKKDSWGMNPPTAWGWEPANLSPHPSGNGGVLVSQGYVVVALKLGSFSPVWASWDNIRVECTGAEIPEPGALLLASAGFLSMSGFAIRRRRYGGR
jgi:hypothetical protein